MTLYDNHEDLKKTARLQEERIKRLATKVIRLAEDKKKLQKMSSLGGGSGQVDMDGDLTEELSEKNQKLESENRRLVKKMDEFKQLYMEQLNKNKIVTSRTDSGLPFPSAGRSSRSLNVPRRSSSLRKVESNRIESKHSKSSTIDLNHHLVAAQEENNNMLQARVRNPRLA